MAAIDTAVPEDALAGARLRFNVLVSILLVLLGVLISWYMFRALYPAEGPAPMYIPKVVKKIPGAVTSLTQSNPAGGPLPPGAAYAIQLPPLSEQATAEQLRTTLNAAGIASAMRVETHVIVGPLRSSAELDAARAKLKELGVFGGQTIIQKP